MTARRKRLLRCWFACGVPVFALLGTCAAALLALESWRAGGWLFQARETLQHTPSVRRCSRRRRPGQLNCNFCKQ